MVECGYLTEIVNLQFSLDVSNSLLAQWKILVAPNCHSAHNDLFNDFFNIWFVL